MPRPRPIWPTAFSPASAWRRRRKAIPWLEKAAEQGQARAQSLLGSCYRDGDGVEADAAQAAEWYGKAAKQNYPPAMCSLGLAFELGEGLTEDPAKAVYWYTKAAGEGYARP